MYKPDMLIQSARYITTLLGPNKKGHDLQIKESFIVLLLHFERIEAAWFRVFWIFSNVDKVEIRVNTNW